MVSLELIQSAVLIHRVVNLCLAKVQIIIILNVSCLSSRAIRYQQQVCEKDSCPGSGCDEK